MKEESPVLNPEESLVLIRQTIDLAKRNVQENGFHLLMWGILVVLAGLTDFFMEMQQGADNKHLSWALMPLVGVPVALIYEMRRKRSVHTQNLVHKWYGLIWLGYGITLVLAIFFAISMDLSPTPLIMAITGFALFMSSVILQFRPLTWGSLVLWAGAAVCMATVPLWHSLIMAICTGVGYLIPGYLLHRLKKG